MTEEPIAQLRRLLIEEHGIPAADVTNDARIVHDLGIDGDDAAELLQRLHVDFGTDFEALDKQWKLFFNSEGAGWRSILLGIPLLLVCGGAAGIIVGRYGWPKIMAYGLAVTVFFAASWLFSRWFGAELRPLTVSGLAEIIQAGRWPLDPTTVH
ncbi:acyl carrier protein [Sphingomonas abaci]|uniref:Acyl carrier protein n=1 Tax=Sphingomonas abaci TaxID=237611 RepID=A0A7W7EZL3_9SPHN|nr:hypothetical protein [Sphingomonas abaci]MBB4619923.1 acyl carrier protein [Sphingomonas abaci]